VSEAVEPLALGQCEGLAHPGAIDAGHVNWVTRRVSQIDVENYKWRRLYQELNRRGKLLWANMRTGSYYYDISYYEGTVDWKQRVLDLEHFTEQRGLDVLLIAND